MSARWHVGSHPLTAEMNNNQDLKYSEVEHSLLVI